MLWTVSTRGSGSASAASRIRGWSHRGELDAGDLSLYKEPVFVAGRRSEFFTWTTTQCFEFSRGVSVPRDNLNDPTCEVGCDFGDAIIPHAGGKGQAPDVGGGVWSSAGTREEARLVRQALSLLAHP